MFEAVVSEERVRFLLHKVRVLFQIKWWHLSLVGSCYYSDYGGKSLVWNVFF